jgi:gamma-glutamylcyclotransferase (GGCT)/AIG2-like uncharacterized protein YtfP
MPSAKVEHIVFYGSLSSGEAPYAELGLARALELSGRIGLRGRLYDLGAYPGLVLGGQRAIEGELHRILDPSVLARLDRFEGYDARRPASSLFRRVSVEVPYPGSHADVSGAAARPITAWIYVFNGCARGRKSIDCKSWREHRLIRAAADPRA